MVYPVKMQVRHSTVLVIVLLLMGSVFYEVTRTESFGRESAARTQDIALPAPQPVVHTVRATTENFIGRTSSGRSPVALVEPDRELLATAAYGSATPTAVTTTLRGDVPGRGIGFAFGRTGEARVHSSGSSGYAAGSYGMGGVGAWGGVSGMMRPDNSHPASAGRKAAATSRPAKEPKEGKQPKPGKGQGSGSISGGGVTAVAGAPGSAVTPEGTVALLTGGFTTGAAGAESGTLVDVAAGPSTAQGPAPAPTPEPMSMLLLGTGLVGLFNVRRHFQ